ncbi:MAG TPA: hypothetical protein EYN96_09880 [Candidatus Hydrogenedentes bacterium]|nr:hypothetical protein [Candidatus Hydrogenedentota bacterium]
MKQFSSAAFFVFTALFLSQAAIAQNLCDSINDIFDQYEQARSDNFGSDNDLDDDGLVDRASLSLIEAVACTGPNNDLKNATETAFAFNLDVIDMEARIADLADSRLLIAAMMVIGADMQTRLEAAFVVVESEVTVPLLTGSYATVQCIGADCTPDPVALGQIQVFSSVTRAVDEPYTAEGDLDLDGFDNLTESNNVKAQNGFTSDFVAAATSSTLNGTEALNNTSLCASMDSVFVQYDQAQTNILGDDGDLANDGLIDRASISLIEAVACIGPNNDLKDATLTAFALNLEVFDQEPNAASLSQYRLLIAAMMLIGSDLQTQLNLAVGEVLTGTYEVVQCAGTACTPDRFAQVSFETRATDEPYSGTGDLDNDGTDNATEAANVKAQNGFTSDFVIAATSPQLNGTEPIRNPGTNDADGNGGGGGGCFIATAAYGTPMSQQVNVLRHFRDFQLLTNPLGAGFVDSYYRASPAVADLIATRPILKSGVRIALMPVIFLIQFPWTLAAALIIMLALTHRLRKNQLSQGQ